jgi:hypothetical protein
LETSITLLPTVFDLHGAERLLAWKSFRNQLESDNSPFQSVVEFWAKAPLVNFYLDPNQPSCWPDPWHLIIDGRYDDLAVVLGMLYTIKLTDRFSNINLEIYMSAEEKNTIFFLKADKNILNLEYNRVIDVSKLYDIESIKIYTAR